MTHLFSFLFPSFLCTCVCVHVYIRVCIKKERKKEKRKKICAVVLAGESFFKIFVGDLSIRLHENFTIYSVFHALSNGVIFINYTQIKSFDPVDMLENTQGDGLKVAQILY
jgi:hypothetical protein